MFDISREEILAKKEEVRQGLVQDCAKSIEAIKKSIEAVKCACANPESDIEKAFEDMTLNQLKENLRKLENNMVSLSCHEFCFTDPDQIH